MFGLKPMKREGQAAPVLLPVQKAAQHQTLSAVLGYLRLIHGLGLMSGTGQLQVHHSAMTLVAAGISWAYPVFR